MLVVDDIEVNRIMLRQLFADEYEVIEAATGRQALDRLAQYGDQISIMLLDLVMPDMDGFQVLGSMNATGEIKRIPVIIITGDVSDERTLSGYALGASDLVSKPFNPEIITRRVNNVADLYDHKKHLEQKLQEQKQALTEQDKRLKQTNMFLIDALSTAVEFRDVESGEHIRRIRNLTKIFLEMINNKYHLPKEEIDAIANASVLHDIGKIAIPDSVLLKPGRLTNEEFEIMKTHSVRGCEILNSLHYMPDQEYFGYCYEICRHHHERWDGKGYPDGLKGDEIPIWAQATSLADVYDALTSDRVYKKAYSHEQAVEMILNGECGTFNPRLMEQFNAIRDDLPTMITLANMDDRNKMAEL
jgi:putative two-component system response regulator